MKKLSLSEAQDVLRAGSAGCVTGNSGKMFPGEMS